MKIEKYMFFLPEANRLAAHRCKTEKLTMMTLSVFYCIRKYSPLSFASVQRKLASFYFSISEPALTLAVRQLVKNGLVERNGNIYAITPLGREYLSYIRRYMFNRRL